MTAPPRCQSVRNQPMEPSLSPRCCLIAGSRSVPKRPEFKSEGTEAAVCAASSSAGSAGSGWLEQEHGEDEQEQDLIFVSESCSVEGVELEEG